jgi:hypothetical protein
MRRWCNGQRRASVATKVLRQRGREAGGIRANRLGRRLDSPRLVVELLPIPLRIARTPTPREQAPACSQKTPRGSAARAITPGGYRPWSASRGDCSGASCGSTRFLEARTPVARDAGSTHRHDLVSAHVAAVGGDNDIEASCSSINHGLNRPALPSILRQCLPSARIPLSLAPTLRSGTWAPTPSFQRLARAVWPGCTSRATG